MHKAKEWILTGRMIRAQEADQAGLINRLTTRELIKEETLALRRKWPLMHRLPSNIVRRRLMSYTVQIIGKRGSLK